MAEFTLLKLEFPDASLTANAPFSGEDNPETAAEATTDDEESRGVLPLVLGLLFLVAVAVAAKKVLGSDDDLTGDDVVADDESLPSTEA